MRCECNFCIEILGRLRHSGFAPYVLTVTINLNPHEVAFREFCMEIIQLANRGVRLRLLLRQNAVHKHFDVGILDVLRVCNAGFCDVE